MVTRLFNMLCLGHTESFTLNTFFQTPLWLLRLRNTTFTSIFCSGCWTSCLWCVQMLITVKRSSLALNLRLIFFTGKMVFYNYSSVSVKECCRHSLFMRVTIKPVMQVFTDRKLGTGSGCFLWESDGFNGRFPIHIT